MLQNAICFKLKLPLKRPRYIYLIVYIMFNICQHPPGLQFYFYKVYYVVKLLRWYCIVYICTPNNIIYILFSVFYCICAKIF